MLKRVLHFIAICTVLSMAVQTAVADPASKKKKTKNKTEVKTDSVAKSGYGKLFSQPHETAEGMFTIHKLKGKVYFEVPDSLLGREMLLGSTIVSTSDNGFGIVGSKPVRPLHFKLTKEGDKLAMRIVSEQGIAPEGSTGIKAALRQGSTGAIYKLFKIEGYSADSTAMAADVTDLFLSHDKYLSPLDARGVNTGMGKYKMTESFSKDKSQIGVIKSFADNVSVSSSLTYAVTVSDRGAAYKDIPVTVTVNRSILLLDREPYRPRITDSRIGIFPTAKIRFAGDLQGTETLYFANRWDLEPSDREAYLKGELVDPVKPIKFYVDNNFPEKWLPSVLEGVRQWSEVFEEIGFKNAVQAELFPVDDPDFDPDNLKYSCVRYAPISIQNAMGPSWVDPRSGEIISASVYIYHDAAKLVNNWLFIQTSPADPRVRGKLIPDEIFDDALRYVVAHEIGHCLGFMHNMSASAVIPTDSLRSPSYTREHGTTTSIMDYARFNYVAQPEDAGKGVRMTPPRFGEYDRYLVRWSYTPLFGETLEDEHAVTDRWLNEASANPVYRYGKQQGRVIDPKSQTEDLGDDAVRSSEYGVENLKFILANLNGWLDGDDRDYTYRRTIYSGIVSQYARYISHVYANVGGILMNEKHVGDHLEAAAPVAAEKQKRALEFLFAQLDGPDWLNDRSITDNIGLVGSASDMLKEQVIKLVVAAPAKIADSERMIAQPFTSEDCAAEVFDYIWQQAKKGQKLNRTQMKAQRHYLRNVSAQAGVALAPEAKTTLYSEDPYSITLPAFIEDLPADICSCAHHAAGENWAEGETSGYGAPSPVYSISKPMEALGYGYMMEAKKLIEKNRNHPDRETRMHYQSMYHDLETALKTDK